MMLIKRASVLNSELDLLYEAFDTNFSTFVYTLLMDDWNISNEIYSHGRNVTEQLSIPFIFLCICGNLTFQFWQYGNHTGSGLVIYLAVDDQYCFCNQTNFEKSIL